MVQSPSWEANLFAASQEISRISRNPKVHYRTHKRPPPFSILGQPNPVHIPTDHLLEIHPNIIHSSTPRTVLSLNPSHLQPNNMKNVFVFWVSLYLLTYSMVQSPSWEANWFAASQEIPRISRNPKVHYRTQKPPPPVPILSQPNQIHSLLYFRILNSFTRVRAFLKPPNLILMRHRIFSSLLLLLSPVICLVVLAKKLQQGPVQLKVTSRTSVHSFICSSVRPSVRPSARKSEILPNRVS